MATSTLGSGTLVLAGTTSGTTTVTATAVAGTTTLTLPAATDTLVGKATTDTLTNKTLTSPTITGVATFAAGTAATPAITTTGDTNTGIFFPAADTIAFTEGGVESMRIDASGRLGVGITSPSSGQGMVQVAGSSQSWFRFHDSAATWNFGTFYKANGTTALAYIGGGTSAIAGGTVDDFVIRAEGNLLFATGGGTERARIDSSGNLLVGTTTSNSAKVTISNAGAEAIQFYPGSASNDNQTLYYNRSTSVYCSNSMYAADHRFYIGGSEKARIDSSGNLLVGKTATSLSTAGHEFFAVGAVYHTRNADPVLLINRLTNDGNLVEFYQAGTLEGAISVSGTTVTYGGGHLARFGQLPDGSEDASLLKGTVLTNLDEMCVWINKETGIPADNEQCNKVKISDVDGDANVAGVFVSWAYDEQHDTNDLYVAMTGDMIIRIAQGTTVQRGDLLMSAGDGTAKPQGDDIVRSKTVAKVTSTHVTCTYEDGSYCVPCVLMAC
jgi:hypothetical protein